MVTAGAFSVMGLLLLALHLARPDLLRWLVAADTQLWWFMPWVTPAMLDPEGTYQRRHRRTAVIALAGLTALSLVLFVLPYAATVVEVLGVLDLPR